MVKWKRKGDVFSMAGKIIFSKPKKRFKPKRIPKPKMPKIALKTKNGMMKMIEVEPELHYKKGYEPKDCGIYKQKRRWF